MGECECVLVLIVHVVVFGHRSAAEIKDRISSKLLHAYKFRANMTLDDVVAMLRQFHGLPSVRETNERMLSSVEEESSTGSRSSQFTLASSRVDSVRLAGSALQGVH